MTITLRVAGPTPKGSALTHAELDGNFTDLDGRVTTLQSGGTGITKTGTPADDQIAVWTGANSLEGTAFLTFANAIFRVISTDSTNVEGPVLRLWRQSSSPANDDNLGDVIFEGRNIAAENIVYARIHSEIANATQDQEAGRLIFLLPFNAGGVLAERDVLKLGPTAEMTLISEDTAAAIGPVFVLDRTSTSPAAADNLGQVTFRGRDSLNGTVDYATIKGVIADATDTGEDGSLEIQVIRNGTLTTMLRVTAGILGTPSLPTASRPAPGSVPDGAMYYDTDLDKPLWSNTFQWFDALRGRLEQNLDARGFTIFGNRPHGILVPGALTLDAALHNGAVLRCSSATGQIITWNNIGDFACMVYADMPVGQSVTIKGTHATNTKTIPAGCCATLVQTTSLTQNVWVSDPRTVVSA